MTSKALEAAEKAYGEHWPKFQDATADYRAGQIGDDEYLAVRKNHEELLAAWDAAMADVENA